MALLGHAVIVFILLSLQTARGLKGQCSQARAAAHLFFLTDGSVADSGDNGD